MVNPEEFLKRLETIFEYYSLSASLFTDKLGVQRSGLSHLLSGRNKPSLDFVMKVAENFPEVDLYWLLNGTGSFPKKESGEATPQPAVPTPPPAPKVSETIPQPKEPVITDLFSQPEEEKKEAVPTPAFRSEVRNPPSGKKTEKIVVFYSDGTFKEYSPDNGNNEGN